MAVRLSKRVLTEREKRDKITTWPEKDPMVQKLIAIALFTLWLVLLAMGKGGFIHLILLGSIGLAFTEIVAEYRSRLRRTRDKDANLYAETGI